MDLLATFLASYLIWVMFLGLFILWIYRKQLQKNQIAYVAAVVIVVFTICQIIKVAFPTERPFLLNGTVPLTVTVPADSAFPSLHTGVAFALAFGLLRQNKKMGLLFMPPALLVGAGRVVSHVHFPIDVLGGALIAFLVAMAISPKRLGVDT